jgi:hypothetical protein
MGEPKLTLGQAIDQIVSALSGLEGKNRITAIAAACSALDMPSPPEAPARVPIEHAAPPPITVLPHQSALNAQPHVEKPQILDIRRLKDQKRPSSARQMVALVAFYLQEHAPEGERKSEIGTEDVEKYFKQAAFKLPGNIGQVLIDSKKSGYVESTSRGQYKLTPVGYNLVVHSLPSGQEQ